MIFLQFLPLLLKPIFLLVSSECVTLPVLDFDILRLVSSFTFLFNGPSPPSVRFTSVPVPKSTLPYFFINSISFLQASPQVNLSATISTFHPHFFTMLFQCFVLLYLKDARL